MTGIDGDAARGRRPWRRHLAAAAVVMAVLAGFGVVLPQLFGGSADIPSAVPEATSAEPSAPEATPTPSTTPADAADIPAAAKGYRWESFRDVMVQVPKTWTYAFAPRADYCKVSKLPTKPYVDLARGGEVTRTVRCTTPLSNKRQVMHLTFLPAGSDLPYKPRSKVWHRYSRTVGDALVTVTAKASQKKLTKKILATAAVVPGGMDPKGCPITVQTVPPTELSDLDSGVITVCLYEASQDRGAFRSSVRLTGSTAQHAWDAVGTAPPGGGPDDADPTSCGPGEGWPVVLYVGRDSVPVAASVAGCTGNGVVDNAIEERIRSLTKDVCRKLLVDPVRIPTGFGPAGVLCVR